MKKVLVPTDFSDSARHALSYGVSFAKEYGAELVLLHVVENITVGYASDLFPVPMAEVFQEISGYAKTELAKLAAEAREKGVARHRARRPGQALGRDHPPRRRERGGHDRPRHPRQGHARPGALRLDHRAGRAPRALPGAHRAHGRARVRRGRRELSPSSPRTSAAAPSRR